MAGLSRTSDALYRRLYASQLYKIKGGLGYNFTKNNQVFIGAGRYGTYESSKFYQQEYRLWLQYIFSQKIDFVRIDHLLPAEKRFFTFPQTQEKTNNERYSYRFSITIPLNGKKIDIGTYILILLRKFS